MTELLPPEEICSFFLKIHTKYVPKMKIQLNLLKWSPLLEITCLKQPSPLNQKSEQMSLY